MARQYTTVAEYDEMLRELINNPLHSNPELQEFFNGLLYFNPTRYRSYPVPVNVLRSFHLVKELLSIVKRNPLNERENIKYAYNDFDGLWCCPECDAEIFDEDDSVDCIFPNYCPICGQKVARRVYGRKV